jgi:polyribonucleotide nucleotidyltransferase
MSKKPREGAGFFPLMIEYQEKAYAAGKVPGGFFKREARPTEKETLTARIIDRPLRPLFPAGFYYDVVVTCNVISSDGENDPDIISMVAASAALEISDIPFEGPVGAARVIKKEGNIIINPTYAERADAELEIFVASVAGGIVMIEGEGKQVPEAEVVEALELAHKQILPMIEKVKEFKAQVGKDKAEVQLFNPHPDLKEKVRAVTFDKLTAIYSATGDKANREDALSALWDEIVANKSQFNDCLQDGEEEVPTGHIHTMYDLIEYEVIRELIFTKNQRADGRKTDELRDLKSTIGVLDRTHGSSVFTRGQTQSLATTTLGTKRDEQMVEGLQTLAYRRFLLHYNFPAFSVGEARGSRGPGRREIGHGALAAKALRGVVPTKDEFPYTIRIVSEILESNGSSSMASVCAGCLSMMDAGVPIYAPIAGISIGLVLGEGDDYRLLTDIMGLEDHHGDMDYKIAGSEKGITAIQLDLKVKGLPIKILVDGIEQARTARLAILKNMTATIEKPKDKLSNYAPRLLSTQVPTDKIGEVIGPGGKMIKRIIEETGCESIDIDDDGKVIISSMDGESAEKAIAFVDGLVSMPVVGTIYDAEVKKVANFGVFCEFMPGKQGLVHVSEMSSEYVKDITTIVAVGDKFKVKLMEIDQQKRMNLSKKAAEAKEEVKEETSEAAAE